MHDPLTIRSILGAVALAKGTRKLGALLSTLDETEIDELLEDLTSWSEAYRSR